jgi:hypothetical protein
MGYRSNAYCPISRTNWTISLIIFVFYSFRPYIFVDVCLCEFLTYFCYLSGAKHLISKPNTNKDKIFRMKSSTKWKHNCCFLQTMILDTKQKWVKIGQEIKGKHPWPIPVLVIQPCRLVVSLVRIVVVVHHGRMLK